MMAPLRAKTSEVFNSNAFYPFKYKQLGQCSLRIGKIDSAFHRLCANILYMTRKRFLGIDSQCYPVYSF